MTNFCQQWFDQGATPYHRGAPCDEFRLLVEHPRKSKVSPYHWGESQAASVLDRSLGCSSRTCINISQGFWSAPPGFLKFSCGATGPIRDAPGSTQDATWSTRMHPWGMGIHLGHRGPGEVRHVVSFYFFFIAVRWRYTHVFIRNTTIRCRPTIYYPKS